MLSIFISHSSIDKQIARRLTAELTRIGVRAWLDEREIKVGDDIIENIESGIRESDYLALVLTPKSVRSTWVTEELNAFRIRQYSEKTGRVLPLLFEDCEIPPMLRSKKYADFRSSFSQGFQELLRAIGIEDQGTAILTETQQADWRSNLSIIWDERGKYRDLSWSEIRQEAQTMRGGIAILTEDLLEMLRYRLPPFREQAVVLRNTFANIISDATEADADMLAKIVISAWEDHKDNICGGLILALMDRQLAATILCKAHERSPGTAKWLYGTLYTFSPNAPDEYPRFYTADLIKASGKLPEDFQNMTHENWFEHV